MFRRIQLSLEILEDVGKRAFVDNKLEAARKHRAKYAEMDKRKREMVDVSVYTVPLFQVSLSALSGSGSSALGR
jgi:hypothetical protein